MEQYGKGRGSAGGTSKWEGNGTEKNTTKICYMHVWGCQSEIHYEHYALAKHNGRVYHAVPESDLHISKNNACSEHFLEYHHRMLIFILWAARAGVLSDIVTIFHKRKWKFCWTQVEYSLVIICTEWSPCWCSCVGLMNRASPGYIGGKKYQSEHLKPEEWSTVLIKTRAAGSGCPVF